MSRGWPARSYEDWRATCDTLHAHTQVLGKLAATLAQPEPELQHAALRLTARGWETAPLPAPDGSGALVVSLDLHDHVARVEHSEADTTRVPLTPNRSVSQVTADVLDALRSVGGPWDGAVEEYILDWDAVCSSEDPLRAAVDFGQSVFRHTCQVCEWAPALLASAEGSPPPVR